MKRLKVGIGLVIVIVLGCWVASRWHTWFVEEDEEAYVVSPSPVHVLLTFGDAQPLSRNVSWQADSVLRPSWRRSGGAGPRTCLCPYDGS